jgi:hypothetical protein
VFQLDVNHLASDSLPPSVAGASHDTASIQSSKISPPSSPLIAPFDSHDLMNPLMSPSEHCAPRAQHLPPIPQPRSQPEEEFHSISNWLSNLPRWQHPQIHMAPGQEYLAPLPLIASHSQGDDMPGNDGQCSNNVPQYYSRANEEWHRRLQVPSPGVMDRIPSRKPIPHPY